MTSRPHHHAAADFWRRGTVVWFNIEKGFGFLQPVDDPTQVFVEYTSIEMTGYKSLYAGQPVLFTATMRKRGPEATAVRPLRPDARPRPR
ncbi:cold shock domain-containing protein [Nocardia beijingensis]|uniref:cold-shock protein n=1 Tax=Nocardia TaxID=1817 RepID=UPI00135C6191|nr:MULTISPECIES: cold shock domain-containing protein [Nocardia]MBF6469025.1 cold shock domain-containing protein [Nocardia beijingensis]